MSEELRSVRPRRRQIYVVILSLLAPGLGHLFAGSFRLGLFLLFITLVNAALREFWLMASPMGLWISSLTGIAIWLFAIIDSIRVGQHPIRSSAAWFQRGYVLFLMFIIYWGVAAGIGAASNFGVSEMSAGSMYPTVLVGDSLVFKKKLNPTHIQRGALIVFLREEKLYLKRVVALPGDKLEARDDLLLINDGPVHGDFAGAIEIAPQVVPEKNLFVLGDDLENSFDSRYWGFVSFESVVGQPLYIYFSRDSWSIRWDRMGMRF